MTRKNKSLTPSVEVPIPSAEELEKHQFDKSRLSENQYAQGRAINTLFFQYPKNDKITEVLLKVCVLNDFYSTNIFSVYDVAKHIVDLKIDKRLEGYDKNLVNDIAKVEIKGKVRNFYSFATKYCAHHNPNDYLIYDSYVHKMLLFFQERDNFYGSQLPDLKNFDNLRNVIIRFREFYGVENWFFRQIDMYLWQVGKKAFPKNYKKSEAV